MVPRILSIFFVILLTAESRPFYGTGGRRTSDSQKVWNLDGAHPAYYPLLPFPVQRSGMSSEFSHLPISQSSLQFSDMLNRVRKDKISSSGSFDEGLQYFDRNTAQMVDQFGQRVRATVRQYEKAHDKGMQNVGKIMEQFNLDEVKDRLKKTLMDKKALLEKLHSIGWRGKYTGVPYNTMNDDHKIVKKPGVYTISLSHNQPNAVLVAPAVQPIPVQHPALPEVTTSVYLHLEPEPTATLDDYVHPTDVNETTEISNSIDDDEKLTINDTTTSEETVILEDDTREIPFSETNSSVSVDAWPGTEDEFYSTLTTDLAETSPSTQEESTTTITGLHFQSTITNADEEIPSLETQGYATATEIIPKYSPTFLTASETSTVPSSTARNPETTSHIISTLSSIFTTVEPVPTSDWTFEITDATFDLVIDGGDREPTTYSPIISTESTSRPTRDSITPVEEVLPRMEYNTSPSFPDSVETSTGASSILLFSGIPTDSTTAEIAREEIAEIIPTSTEESESTSSETTFWQPITSEATTEVVSTFSSMETERPTTIHSGEASTFWEETSTTSSSIDSETTGAISTVLNPTVYDPTFEIAIRHLETSSTFPTTIASQTTSSFEEIPTTQSSSYGSPTIDVGMNTVLHDSTISEGNYLTSPATDNEVQTTTIIGSKFHSMNPIESVTLEAGSSTTSDSGFDPSRIHTDSTTEASSTSHSTIFTEKTTSSEEISEIEDTYFGIPTIGTETTTEILLPFYHSIPQDTTVAFNESFTTTTESSIDNSMIDEETTETSSTLSVTVLTEETTDSNPGISTLLDGLPRFVNYYPIGSTSHVDTTTVIDSESFSKNPIESVTVEADSSTTLDSGFDPSRIDTDRTTETPSTLQSAISTEKTISSVGIIEIEDTYFGIPTIGTETTTEILLPFYHSIPQDTTVAFNELFTTTTESSIDNSMIDEETTETSSTLSVTVLTEETTNSNPEITALLDGLPRFVNYYPIGSTSQVETTTVIDSTIHPTTSIETATLRTGSLSTVEAAFESSTIVIGSTTETGSTSQSTTPADKTTILNEIPLNGYSDSDIPIIEDETATEVLSPFSSTIPTETTTATEFRVECLMTGEETSEITSPFPVIVTTMESTTSGVEALGSDGSTRFESNYLQTSSSIEVETSPVPDSTFSSASESPAIDIESTTETASTSRLAISTEKNTVSITEEISAMTDSYLGSSTISVETTTEILLPFSDTRLTHSTEAFDQLSTTATETSIDNAIVDYGTTETILTLENKATTALYQEITTLSDYLPRSADNYLTEATTEAGATTVDDSTFYLPNPTEPIRMGTESWTTVDSAFVSSTTDAGSTTETLSTFQSPILTERTTTSEEVSEITSDSYFGIPTIDEETISRISLPFSYSDTVSKEPTLTFDELATKTTKSPIGGSIIDEETTDVMATLSVLSGPTTTSASEMTTIPNNLPRLVNNYLTASTTDMKSTTESVSISSEKTTTLEERSTTDSPLGSSTIDITSLVSEERITGEVYSIFSSTIPTGIAQITTVYPTFEGSTIDTESSSVTVSTISLPILTEETTTSDGIPASTGLPLESSTIYKETTTVIIPTETTTSFEDVSEATDTGTNGVVDDGETTTEIVSTVSPTFSTETSVESASVYDFEPRSDSGDLDENFTPVLPELARAAVEEPDVKALLNLIPLIIEELRKNNLSTAEVYTLRQVFGNVWPLLVQESKRKPGESVNHKLAILLYGAGQRLSDIN